MLSAEQGPWISPGNAPWLHMPLGRCLHAELRLCGLAVAECSVTQDSGHSDCTNARWNDSSDVSAVLDILKEIHA